VPVKPIHSPLGTDAQINVGYLKLAKGWIAGLRFCTELGICMRFDNINFFLHFISGNYPTVNHLKFAVFLQFYQNSVVFLQKKHLSCITTTYSEKPEGASLQER